MFRLDVLQNQWLIVALVGGTLVLFTLRPRGAPSKSADLRDPPADS